MTSVDLSLGHADAGSNKAKAYGAYLVWQLLPMAFRPVADKYITDLGGREGYKLDDPAGELVGVDEVLAALRVARPDVNSGNATSVRKAIERRLNDPKKPSTMKPKTRSRPAVEVQAATDGS